MDIYNLCYQKVYTQCLKLLDPASDAFALHQPTLTDEELELLDAGRIVKDVRSGSPDLANINQRSGQQFPLPILFLEIGTGGIDFLHPSLANAMKGELFHVKIRCVIDKPPMSKMYETPEARYEDSAPVKLLKIRNTLDYLLDISVFRGLRSTRVGYDFPSLVWECGIMAMESLEGLPASFDALDWRFVAEIHKQATRGA